MDIKNITNEDFVFTLKKIEMFMDYETSKPEEEMDTEMVALCASILAKAYNPNYKDEKPVEMYRPWEKEINLEVAAKVLCFDALWAMSEEEKAEFSEENLIKMIKAEKKKVWFLRDYGLIHECYLTLFEVYGYTYNNEYEKKAKRHSVKIRLKNKIKDRLMKKQKIMRFQ